MKENNIHHKVAHLMKDEKFIEWKLFPNEEINSYWKKYLEENPQEKETFDIADKRFPKVKMSSRHISDNQRQLVIERILKSLSNKRKKTTLRSITFFAAAASIAALVFVAILYNTNTAINDNIIVGSEIGALDIQLLSNNRATSFQENIDIEMDEVGEMKIKTSAETTNEIVADKESINTLIVPFGKRSTILLSDGSKVWLNSGTILEFPSKFTSDTRTISLKTGEIYVEAVSNSKKPFFVTTSDFAVKVYGTKFNVSAYNNKSTSVMLAEGSVSLIKEGKDELIVNPSELVELNNENNFVKQKVDIDSYTSWKNGYLLFKDSPITEVLRELEKYYNLSFDIDNEKSFRENRCKGKIVLSENLDNVLATLSLLTHTEYKREENNIYIITKKR